jgi:hypothetical protein
VRLVGHIAGGLQDVRDRHPIPFGRAFRIHLRLCGRNHRATCREVRFGNTPATDIHSLVAGSSGACREPRLLRLLPAKLKRQKQEPLDVKAKQVLSAFAVNTALVLAHIEIDENHGDAPRGVDMRTRGPERKA